MSNIRMEDLLARRDAVNELFLDFTAPGKMTGNFTPLANLALIGGRLDKLIRDELAERRRANNSCLPTP